MRGDVRPPLPDDRHVHRGAEPLSLLVVSFSVYRLDKKININITKILNLRSQNRCLYDYFACRYGGYCEGDVRRFVGVDDCFATVVTLAGSGGRVRGGVGVTMSFCQHLPAHTSSAPGCLRVCAWNVFAHFF